MVDKQKSVSMQYTQSERNKTMMLNMLERVTFHFHMAQYGIQRARFEGVGDPDLIENMQKYISSVVSLWVMIRPKLNSMGERGDKFKGLFQFDNYIDGIANIEANDLTDLFNIFNTFTKLEATLREVAEELGVTVDKPVGDVMQT